MAEIIYTARLVVTHVAGLIINIMIHFLTHNPWSLLTSLYNIQTTPFQKTNPRNATKIQEMHKKMFLEQTTFGVKIFMLMSHFLVIGILRCKADLKVKIN